MQIPRPEVNLETVFAAFAFVLLWFRRVWICEQVAVNLFRAWCAFQRLSGKNRRAMIMTIKETLDVIDFGMAVADGVFASLKGDGKITMTDVGNFLPALTALPAALESADKVPAELTDLSEEEFGQIRDHIFKKLPDIGDRWVVIAKESIAIAMSAYRMIVALRAHSV